jgi:methionyl-tRNA synthetase
MAETPQTFFLTTPIYYVNARPHIGHAYTTIVGDVLARRSRAQGIDTYFLTGTDEHGQKIERSAAAAGIVPQQFADQVSKTFSDLWQRMGITHDKFIRTTDEAHKRGVQKLFTTLQANGAIYKDTYTGQYCVSDEAFVDVAPGAPCPDCGRPTETISETNYYFKLSEYQQRLLDLIESNTLLIQPDSRHNEVLSFLRGPVNTLGAPRLDSETWVGPPQPSHALTAAGTPYIPGALKDLSISRTSFQWGIPVPGDESHVIYVWLDALANYMTALGYGSDDESLWEKYWGDNDNILHIVGKEIIRFHCVYWPAFLMAAGLPLPKQVVAHGWLLFEESKMSKSKGNIVRTETILDAFGTLCPPPQSLATGSFGHQGLTGGSVGLQPHESSEPLEGALAPDSPTAKLPAEATIKGTTSVVPPESPAQAPASAAETILPAESERALLKHHQDLFAADILRYFLLREIPFGQDGSFSFDALITRYNADLANGYGNLVSRTLSMIQKYLDGVIPVSSIHTALVISESAALNTQIFDRFVNGNQSGAWQIHLPSEAVALVLAFDFNIRRFHFIWALQACGEFIRMLDYEITSRAPWKVIVGISDEDMKQKRSDILHLAAESIRIITALLYPILPYATASVWRQLGLGDIERAARNGELKNLQWGGLRPGTKLGPLSPIFPRADKGLAQIMTDMENPQPIACVTGPHDPPSAKLSAITAQHDATHPATDDLPTTPIASEQSVPSVSSVLSLSTPTDSEPQITIDDFAKVELRVAQVIVAERIPKADKLLRLEVDLGYEKRQILSGIAEWYTPEELIGRRIVVIVNLAPRKMRGLESHGMLLAASTEGGKPYLCTFADAESLPLGSRIK